MPTVTVTAAGEQVSVDYGQPVLYGSGIGGWWQTLGEAKVDAYARIVRAFGGRLPVVRLFSSSVPSYVDPSSSVSLDTGDTVTAQQVVQLAARRGDQFLSVAHEPNHTGKTWTPASWGQRQRDTLALVQANSGGNVHLVPTLEGQAFIAKRNPAVPAAAWFGWDMTGIDYIGADLYQWGKDNASADTALTVLGGAIDLAKQLGKRLVINELGARRVAPPYSPGISDTARAKFLTDVIALCDANAAHVAAVMLFESDNGKDGMTPWPITHPTNTNYSPQAVAVWRTACTSHPSERAS